MATLTDDDLMPFGKYKGKKMGGVPANYILYMYEEIRHIAPNKRNLNQAMFVKYAEENKQVLEKQAKEYRGAKE